MLLHGAVDHLGHLGGLIGGLSIMPLIVLRSNTVLISTRATHSVSIIG